MSTEALLTWMLITAATLVASGVGAYLRVSVRVTRIETVMIMFSKNAAKVLHSPDDHLGLDELVEKYLNNHYDLTNAEWKQLELRCEEIINDPMVDKSERLAAAQLHAIVISLSKLCSGLAKHKQMRYTG